MSHPFLQPPYRYPLASRLPSLPRTCQGFGDQPALPWVAFGCPLERMEGAGQGGAGQALMQSRGAAGKAAALEVGGRRLPLPPPLRPARAQSEQDLVPCSGYCALSARAASLKQLASKNTLGLGSGSHGRRVCFYTPAPISRFLGLALGWGAHWIWLVSGGGSLWRFQLRAKSCHVPICIFSDCSSS